MSKKSYQSNEVLLKRIITTLRIVVESFVVAVVGAMVVLGAPTRCRRSGGKIAAKLSLSV